MNGNNCFVWSEERQRNCVLQTFFVISLSSVHMKKISRVFTCFLNVRTFKGLILRFHQCRVLFCFVNFVGMLGRELQS
jgi:hypothetical protein